jgi:hypothetical protein
MARYSAGMTASGAGTTVRPIFALTGSTATFAPVLREIGLFNTTATSCVYRLVTFTGGTAGAASLTTHKHNPSFPAAIATPKSLWTADATVVTDCGHRVVLGAAIGSGAIFTFGDAGLSGDLGTTAGIGLVPVGTGQVCEVYFVWDE